MLSVLSIVTIERVLYVLPVHMYLLSTFGDKKYDTKPGNMYARCDVTIMCEIRKR